jgi:hypothetical protein
VVAGRSTRSLGMAHSVGIFRVAPRSKPDGTFAAAWFDDEPRLWDDARLRRPDRLGTTWSPPRLLLHPSEKATEVLFNPNAYAVSERIRESLHDVSEIEFLPIHVAGAGVFYLLHVVASLPVPPMSLFRRAPPPSGNIIDIQAFPHGWEPAAAVFRVQQPQDSAAGKAGSCALGIFANSSGARSIEFACGKFLEMRQLGHA